MPAPPAPFRETSPHTVELRERSGCLAVLLCAGHAQQLGGESPLANLMEVKA